MSDDGKPPIVSVCIITYNQERYIRECIQSVVEQIEDLAIEIIIGDDASTDSTRNIIEEFKVRFPHVIKTIYQEKNVDSGHTNFITVHNAATGKYVAHIDGDDLMGRFKLKRQIEFLECNPEFTVCWHRAKIIDENGKVNSESKSLDLIYPGGIVEAKSILRYGVSPIHSTIMYRRSIRRTFSPDFLTLDLFYSIEYLLAGRGKIMNESLGCFRVTLGTLGSRNNVVVRRLYAHHLNFYLGICGEYREDIFLNSTANMLRDVYSLRSSFVSFGLVALRARSLVNICKIGSYFRIASKIKAYRIR